MTVAADLRVELQAEVAGHRESLFPLVATADGLACWIDAAALDARVGGGFRFRLLDGVAAGRVTAYAPVQHIAYAWDWEGASLGVATTLAFDLIAHGLRTHLTLRHVGFRTVSQAQLHDALWRYWFGRLVGAARAASAWVAGSSD